MLVRKRGRTFAMNRMTAMIVEKCKITYDGHFFHFLNKKNDKSTDIEIEKKKKNELIYNNPVN